MSGQRVLKQGFYAVLFSLVGVIAVSGSLLLFVSPPKIQLAQPSPSPASSFELLKIERVDFITHAGTLDIVARIHNPNAHAGIGLFPIRFSLIGQDGKAMNTVTAESYILPGSTQYVSMLEVPISQPVSDVKADFPKPLNFQSLPEALRLPTFSTFLYNRTDAKPGQSVMEEQKGIVTNTSTFDFNRVEVTILAFDAQDKLAGIGTTFLGSLNVQEQREFTVLWAKPAVPADRIIAAPTTNIFKEDNIIRALGNPGLLR